jgi:hypothetical protein
VRYLQSDDYNRQFAVVCDIDGVLADNAARLAVLDRSAPDWEAFHATQEDDPVLAPTAALLRLLWTGGVYVVLLSNRPDIYREATERWLAKHGLKHDRLMMRAPEVGYHDSKPAAIQSLIDKGFHIKVVIDDDPVLCEEIAKAHPEIPVLYVHSGYYSADRIYDGVPSHG